MRTIPGFIEIEVLEKVEGEDKKYIHVGKIFLSVSEIISFNGLDGFIKIRLKKRRLLTKTIIIIEETIEVFINAIIEAKKPITT